MSYREVRESYDDGYEASTSFVICLILCMWDLNTGEQLALARGTLSHDVVLINDFTGRK